MDTSSQKGLFASIFVHGVLFTALIIPLYIGSCSHKESKKHVFKLEPGPQSIAQNQKTQTQPIAQAKPKPPEPKPAPTQKPPKPEVVAMSYQDFIKTQGKPKVAQPKKEAVVPVVAPKIKTQNVRESLESSLSAIQSLNVEEISAYEALIRSRLDAFWEEPASFLGYTNSAVVDFDVDTKGAIVAVRIAKSSGSPVFDDSIKKAFGRVGMLGSPPNKRTNTFEMSFSKK